MNIASLLSARDDEPAEALQHYRRALALREWPADTAAHAEYNAALALQTLGGASNISAAIAALRRALRRSPQFALALEFLDELEEPAVDAASEAAWRAAAPTITFRLCVLHAWDDEPPHLPVGYPSQRVHAEWVIARGPHLCRGLANR